MKKVVFFLLTVSFSISVFAAAHLHDHPSIHGMLIVGRSKIYLSHLPMFHSPHDYQVILEARFSQKGQNAYLESQANSDETVYTLVPESFVLPEMVRSPRPFQAQIYKGHFERGGAVIADNVTVTIDRVLYFKKFSLNEAKPKNGSYVLFGNESEMFLAHSIKAKPDFDQVLQVETSPDLSEVLKTENSVPVDFPNLLNVPIDVHESLDANISNANQILRPHLKIQKMIYLETGDLS